jgi:hypothetical protein
VERSAKIRISGERENGKSRKKEQTELMARKHSQDKQNGFTESVLEPTDHEKRGEFVENQPEAKLSGLDRL